MNTKQKNIDLYKNFRRNVRVFIAASGKSVPDVSEELCMQRKRLSDMLIPSSSRVPTGIELMRISEYLKVSLDDLVNNQVKLTF